MELLLQLLVLVLLLQLVLLLLLLARKARDAEDGGRRAWPAALLLGPLPVVCVGHVAFAN